MHTVDIYRGPSLLVTIKPDNSSNQTKVIMGENSLRLSFVLDRYVEFFINDWCIVFGERYHLNTVPQFEKKSQFDWKYSLVLHSEGTDVSKVQFLYPGPDNKLTQGFFSLMANAEKFMQLILQNIERVYTGYSIGEVVKTDYKNLTFDAENCYNVLGRLAKEFDTEFWIDGKVLHLTKRAVDTPHSFEQGQGKGLYDVTRRDLNGAAVATRLWVYGSERNIPADYRNYEKRLLLPQFHPGMARNINVTYLGATGGKVQIRITYDPPTAPDATLMMAAYRPAGSNGAWSYTRPLAPGALFVLIVPAGAYEIMLMTRGGQYSGLTTPVITVSGTSGPFVTGEPRYIEKNVDVYGVIEHTVIFDDVYPRRTGKVTAVNANDPFEFTDSSMDFDLTTTLQPGLAAKVVFNTGQLTGYSFKISSYDHTTKKFIILKNEEERNIVVPSASLKPKIGDEYVIIDIKMPQIYIDKAEAELLTRSQAMLDVICEQQVSYSVNIDPLYARRKGMFLQIGNMVGMKDKQMNLSRKIRVTKTIRNLIEEEKYTIEIADRISPSQVTRTLAAVPENTRDITNLERNFVKNAILNGEVVGTLVFSSMPRTNTVNGFLPVYIEVATGKLFAKL